VGNDFHDIEFSDLGLVVIDEEQRFGVEHKEHLKGLRASVDVLTMTATPIPRTLHMALLGLRDISSLTTPPLDRRAIHTEVVHYDERLIREEYPHLLEETLLKITISGCMNSCGQHMSASIGLHGSSLNEYRTSQHLIC